MVIPQHHDDARGPQSSTWFAWINEGNRLKDIVEIERAISDEAKLKKEKPEDRFTKRKGAPSLVTKTRDADVKPSPVASPPKMKREEPVVSSLPG